MHAVLITSQLTIHIMRDPSKIWAVMSHEIYNYVHVRRKPASAQRGRTVSYQLFVVSVSIKSVFVVWEQTKTHLQERSRTNAWSTVQCYFDQISTDKIEIYRFCQKRFQFLDVHLKLFWFGFRLFLVTAKHRHVFYSTKEPLLLSKH